MAFNIEKLVRFCIEEIEKFSVNHQTETFYGFAIDASLLCLNSVEGTDRTLKEYQDRETRLMQQIKDWKDVTEEVLLWDGGYRFGVRKLEDFRNLEPEKRQEFLLNANSNREIRKEKGNSYHNEINIKHLRENTGDWKYMGFAEMTAKQGFDSKAYYRHYDMSDKRQLNSAYGKAMDEILIRIKESNGFKCLKTTNDFYVIRVEHNY